MKNKKLIIIIAVVVILIITLTLLLFTNNNKKTDAYKFAQEYSGVSKENVFVYRTAEEIIKILENGTGIVYLGFPECKWCQRYVTYLDEVAQDIGIDKIYYYNIKEDRANNTKNYQKIVEILKDNLENDEEGNPRIYVPDVTFIKKGEIIGHDNETSMESGEPNDYWTEEKINKLKDRLNTYMLEANPNTCDEGCDE